MMTQGTYAVRSVEEAAPNIYVLSMHAPQIARSIRAGQFLNIRTGDSWYPLLRRPFSVYDVAGDDVRVIFNIVGAGTRILAASPAGSLLDVLGPLGNAYGVDEPIDEAILVAGGLGVAPLPVLTGELARRETPVRTFLGARTSSQIVTSRLRNVAIATDDGSAGHRGTVVDLLRSSLAGAPRLRRKIFACGPTPMLRALTALAADAGIPCELSLESPMACGVGICQGCPVEMREGTKKYALICREGTVFDAASVVL